MTMSHLTDAITYISDLVEQILTDTISESDLDDLTQKQLQCMRIIVRLHNPTITELARELKVTKPTTTVLVDKLVAKKYVRRVSSDQDRRVTHLHIDENGKKIELWRELSNQRLSEQIQSGLNEDETEALAVLLRKISM